MADEDSNKEDPLRKFGPPEPKSPLGKIGHTKPEQKPEPSIPPKSEGISPQFKSGYEEGYKDCAEPPKGASAEFKKGYEQGCKDAKGGKPKIKFQ